jgi:type I restriction enzyme S subunit
MNSSRWPLTALKRLVDRKITDGPHVTPDFVDEGVPFLSVDGIQDSRLVFDNCRRISIAAHREYSRKCKPRRGDLLIAKAASTGKVAQVDVDFEFSVWSPLALISPDQQQIDNRFLFYALISPEVQARIDLLCTFNTQRNVSMGDLGQLQVPVPTRTEQRAIADFLDRETARIDEMVKYRHSELARLDELRRCVIDDGLLRGWAGMFCGKSHLVPVGCRVQRIKHVASVRGRIGFRGYTSADLVREGDGALTIGATQINTIDQLDLSQPEYLSWEKYHESPEIKLETGDVLVVQRGSTIGKCAIVDRDIGPATINPSMIVLKNSAIRSRYLWYFLQTSVIRGAVDMVASVTAIPMITQTQVSNWQILFPEEVEQQIAICARLDQRLQAIERAGLSIHKAISLARECRASLISAAVTGQIDVRTYRAQEAATVCL